MQTPTNLSPLATDIFSPPDLLLLSPFPLLMLLLPYMLDFFQLPFDFFFAELFDFIFEFSVALGLLCKLIQEKVPISLDRFGKVLWACWRPFGVTVE